MCCPQKVTSIPGSEKVGLETERRCFPVGVFWASSLPSRDMRSAEAWRLRPKRMGVDIAEGLPQASGSVRDDKRVVLSLCS